MSGFGRRCADQLRQQQAGSPLHAIRNSLAEHFCFVSGCLCGWPKHATVYQCCCDASKGPAQSKHVVSGDAGDVYVRRAAKASRRPDTEVVALRDGSSNAI